MLLGSADILLDELLALLTPRQTAIVHQVAVCYGPMSLPDLSCAFVYPNDEPFQATAGPDGAEIVVMQFPRR